MRFNTNTAAMLAALTHASTAFPSYLMTTVPDHPLALPDLEKRYDGFSDNLTERLGVYMAPGPNDSRGPCPALNTLANHGLINRNGKNLNSSDIKLAFPRGFGIREDGFDTALHNFEIVCEYIKGTTCGTTANDGTFILTNLTILGEPHAFEHDHSFSRQDYKQNYAHGAVTDNIYFNSSEFQNSLNVVNYHPSNPPVKELADYQDFNEIRLQRMSQQNSLDFPGTFKSNIPTMVFEIGFIFGAMFDRDSQGNMVGATPSVRLDWWNFWFSEESFPTQLGWVPASTEVFNFDFITSVSSAVLSAPVTSTPTNLPSGALAASQSPAANLPEADPSPTVPLFQGTPYIAPTAPSAIKPEATYAKRQNADAATSTSIPASVSSDIASVAAATPSLISAIITAIPEPSVYNPYMQALDVTSLRNQVAAVQSFESAVLSAAVSVLSLAV